VTFKLHDLALTNTSIKVASHENTDSRKWPKLTLTYYNSGSTAISDVYNYNTENRLSSNPATNQVQILGDDIKEVELLNLNGQIIHQSNQPTINLSPFPKGIYLVRIKTTDTKTIINKLVVK